MTSAKRSAPDSRSIRNGRACLGVAASLLLLGMTCPGGGGGIPMRKIGNMRFGLGCQYDNFVDAILAAQDGDVLVVRSDRSFSEDVQVDKDVLIIGSGSPICTPVARVPGAPRPVIRPSGNGTTMVIRADVVLADLRLEGGNFWYDGGNLRVEAGASALLDHVDVRGGEAQRGGGIYAAGDLTLRNGTVVADNFATEGGGVYIEDASLSLGDVTIESNETETDGAGIYALDSDVGQLVNTVASIRSNVAGIDGGGMWLSGGSLDLPSAVFEGNHAIEQGGGLRVVSASGVIAIGDLTDNDAGQGGGIYAEGATISQLGLVSGNSAAFGGGALLSAAHLVDFAEFEDNEASVVGGGVAMYYGSTWSPGGSLIDNRAGQLGGGALLSGATIDWGAGYGTIEGNQAGTGGGVYLHDVTSSALLLGHASVRGNVATGSGGAVFANGSQAGSTVQMTAATELEDNVAVAYGGGIAAQGHLLLYLKELKARRNHAGASGGAIATLLDDTGFAPNLIVFNRDDGVAGCLHAPIDPPADAYCVEFRENTAGIDGGALYLEEVTGSVDQAAFVANDAGGRGDAIALSPTGAASSLQMDSVLFADHVAASEVVLVDAGAELHAQHLSAGDNAGVPIRWSAGASGSLRNSAIADTAMVVDAAVGALPAECNAIFAAPSGGGSLSGSFDTGFTSADFAVDLDRGRFQVDPGNGFLLDRCKTGGATDIDEKMRDAVPDRGAFEHAAVAVAVVPAKP